MLKINGAKNLIPYKLNDLTSPLSIFWDGMNSFEFGVGRSVLNGGDFGDSIGGDADFFKVDANG